MPFNISDYTNIPSSGVLPNDMVPADQISFGYSFTYQKDVDPFAGLQSTLNGQVVLELKDSAGNLKATFDLRETFRIVILPLAPSLIFYLWNWDVNKEKFEGTDASGEPLETEGASSLGVLPSGGSDSSDRTAYVSATFYSFVFNVDVDEGDVLKIKRHTLSAGTVVAKASLKVATRPGNSKRPALVDHRQGQQLRVSSKSKVTRLIRSRRLNSLLPESQTEWAQGTEGLISSKVLGGIHMSKAQGNSLYVLGTLAGKILLYRSQDAGKTWKLIMSATSNIKILAAHLATGGRYIIYGLDSAQKPSYVILKHGQDQWTVSETGLCTLASPSNQSTTPVVALPTSKVNTLQEGEGGLLRLLATDKAGALLLYLSRDGKAWEQAPTAPDSES